MDNQFPNYSTLVSSLLARKKNGLMISNLNQKVLNLWQSVAEVLLKAASILKSSVSSVEKNSFNLIHEIQIDEEELCIVQLLIKVNHKNCSKKLF